MEDFEIMQGFESFGHLDWDEYSDARGLKWFTWMKRLQISGSEKLVPFFWCSTIFWKRSPLLQYSMTILTIKNLNQISHEYHKELVVSSMNASLYAMMDGCLIEARILTSFNAFCFSLSERLINLTCLSAYSALSESLLTLYTLLYAPSPMKC